MSVLDDLGLTREDMADLVAKRERHLQRLITEASHAVEHVRHRHDCQSSRTGADEHCECGAVAYLNRLSAAIRNA